MRYRKANKWRRYLNMLLGVNIKPVTRINSIEPGSRCLETPNDELQPVFRENTIYYAGINDGQPKMC